MQIILSRNSNWFHLLATLPVKWSFNQLQKGFTVDDRKIASWYIWWFSSLWTVTLSLPFGLGLCLGSPFTGKKARIMGCCVQVSLNLSSSNKLVTHWGECSIKSHLISHLHCASMMAIILSLQNFKFLDHYYIQSLVVLTSFPPSTKRDSKFLSNQCRNGRKYSFKSPWSLLISSWFNAHCWIFLLANLKWIEKI